VQMILLGGLARLYGRVEGLPSGQRLGLWMAALRLETSVLVAFALVLLGIGGTIAALGEWSRVGFGALDPRGTIRVVLPSATLVALGALWLFTGLVASLLTLRGLHPPPGAAPLDASSDGEAAEDRDDEFAVRA
jgi:hypothetical protein